jgi:hypothetical protein
MLTELNLPEVAPINIRCEADYYGASHLIAQQLGLTEPPISTSTWVHGCDMFPMPRAVFSPSSSTPEQTLLVGNLVAQEWWQNNGYSRAVAVGCPFIYTHPSGYRRVPGSVLAMPSHGIPGSKRDNEQTEAWFNEVGKLRPRYSPMVCLHMDDVDSLKPYLERLKLPWFAGASLHYFSLPRIRAMFDSFDIVVSDVQGSHLPYAAWCGCGTVLLEPLFERKWEHFKDHVHFQKHPQLIQNLVFHQADFIRERLPFLFTGDLANASRPLEWAANLLGVESKRSPQEMARLLGWRWSPSEPAFADLPYDKVAAWLGAVSPDLEHAAKDEQIAKLKQVQSALKLDLKDARSKVKQSDHEGRKQVAFNTSISGKIGRKLFSTEKRVRSLFDKKSD